MKFKATMYLTGSIFYAGDEVNITMEQYRAIKAWIDKKSLKTYAHVCIHCFSVHGLFYVPWKFYRILWNTYCNGFYKTVARNIPVDKDGKELEVVPDGNF